MTETRSPVHLACTFLQVVLQSAPLAPQPSAHSSCLSASISSTSMLDVTLAPSSIIAAKQLQALGVAAAAWQSEATLMQQLLLCLSASSGCSGLSASGASCWLVNQTGTPVSFVVADVALNGAAAAAAMHSIGSSTSPGANPVTFPAAEAAAAGSIRGRAVHMTPVPLQVLDVAAAEYHGRFVDKCSISSSLFQLQAGQHSRMAALDAADAAGSGRAGPGISSSAGVKRSHLLYVQTAGQVDVTGPVSLAQLGSGLYPMRFQPGAAGSPGVSPVALR